MQFLIDLTVHLHQHLQEFDERRFDLSANLEQFSSLAIFKALDGVFFSSLMPGIVC